MSTVQGIEADLDGAPADVAAWAFFGPARVAELTLGNGLVCTHMNNTRTRSAVQSGAGEANPAWGDKATGRLGYGVPSPPSPLRRASGGRIVSGYGETRKGTP